MTTLTSLQHEEHVNKQLSGRLAEVEEQLSQSSQSLLLNQRSVPTISLLTCRRRHHCLL